MRKAGPLSGFNNVSDLFMFLEIIVPPMAPWPNSREAPNPSPIIIQKRFNAFFRPQDSVVQVKGVR